MRVAIAGGVTGGHLFPALVVGEALQARGHEVLYIGSQHGLEARRTLPLPKALIPMEGLRSTRRTPWSVPLTLWRATQLARQILAQFDPHLLFTTGGYASIPVAAAHRRSARPMILLEPDALPGKANRLLARHAYLVCLNFEEAGSHFLKGIVQRTGLPMRPEVFRPEISPAEARRHFQLDPNRFTVLVIGGSQGAQSLNEVILNTVQYIPSRELQWLHVTGTAHFDTVRATADRLGLNGNYRAVPFLEGHEIGLAYSAAEVAVARGGAGTITELARNGIPMILVPYPHSAGGHQRYNCGAMEARGAGILIEQHALTPQKLAQHLMELRDCPDKRQTMSQAGMSWAIPDATQRVVRHIEEALRCSPPQASD
ncbi:MAG: hypothetical protein C4337_01840 [Armatimonadota bacterium]